MTFNKNWALLLLPVVVIIALALTGDAGREALRYQREAVIDQHEYWRLLTGHLVHADWHHVWMNLAGLALMVALFHRMYSVSQWCGIALFSALCIDLGFIFLMPYCMVCWGQARSHGGALKIGVSPLFCGPFCSANWRGSSRRVRCRYRANSM
jgi:membrane associated rhomboid family serine protease